MDPIHGLDWGTYYFFRNQRVNGTLDLDSLMLIGTGLGSYMVLGPIALLILLFLWRHFGTGRAIAFAIVTAIAVALAEGLKRAVHRPRPTDAELWLSQSELRQSFPSASALLASFLMLVLVLICAGSIPTRAWRVAGYAICIGFVLVLAVTQLYLGLHFVTDLFAGWTAGVLLGLILAGFLGPKSTRRS